MRRLIFPILGVFLFCSVPSAAAVEFGRYRALVIGINDYRHLPNLETAVNDASAMADLLRRQYGYEVSLLLNPTRYQMVRALNEMRAELTPDDNLLIYYAGHGVLDRETDRGFWLPIDAETDNEANWISNETLTSNLRAMSAKHVLVIADSCYAGTLVRTADAELKTGTERNAWLRRMAESRSRTAIVSGGLEPVSDGGGDGHSVFARKLLEALRGNDDVMEAQGLFDRIKGQVVVNADQTPRYSDIRRAGHEGGDFLFVPTALTSAEETPSPPTAGRGVDSETAVELAFWDAIEDSREAADYQAYLDAYPRGRFASLARLRQQRFAVAARPPAPAPRQPSPVPEPAPQAAPPLPTVLAPAPRTKPARRLAETSPPPTPEPEPETKVAAAPIVPKAAVDPRRFDGDWRGDTDICGRIVRGLKERTFRLEYTVRDGRIDGYLYEEVLFGDSQPHRMQAELPTDGTVEIDFPLFHSVLRFTTDAAGNLTARINDCPVRLRKRG